MSAPDAARVVIVGAGQAGMQAATSLRQAKHEGPITLIGAEIEPPYERPPLSKAVLLGELPGERTILRRPEFYAKQQIDLRLGTRVVAIEREARVVRLEPGDPVPYDALILATGARAQALPIEGADLAGIFSLRTLEDTRAIQADMQALKRPPRAVIVGGGYIGMEVAASLRKRGALVHVVEALPRIMARGIAAPVAAFFAERHVREGVEVLTGATVTAFDGDRRVGRVELADGTRLDADLVVIGIGAAINDELARDAGLESGGGVVVDNLCRTVDARVFAIGDVSLHDNAFLGRRVRLESVQNAVSQAKCVARTIAGVPTVYDEPPWFWTQQYDLRLQMVGWAEDDMVWVRRGDPQAGAFAWYGLAGGVVAAVQAVNSTADYALGRKLVRERVEASPALIEDSSADLRELVG